MTESTEPESPSLEVAEEPVAPEFFDVAAVEEFADGKGKSFNVEGKDVAVFKIGDEFHAIGNACPHYGAMLCDGYVRNETVMCPWHGWQFDLKTGKGMTIPGMDVKSFPVKVEDGKVKVAAI